VFLRGGGGWGNTVLEFTLGGRVSIDITTGSSLRPNWSI